MGTLDSGDGPRKQLGQETPRNSAKFAALSAEDKVMGFKPVQL